jgi:apolipoprotein N-acyltransferase
VRARLLTPALVITGGLLYASAFPPHTCDLAAWIALAPLLAVAARTTPAGAFAAGFTYGATFFAATVPWVVAAVAAYFDSGLAGAVAISGAICVLFVSIPVGLFASGARALLARGPWRAGLGVPALWVTFEYARATLLTGLPWELLGHSQWQRIPMIQIADLGGVYAISFVVAAVNVGAYLALRALVSANGPRRLLPAGVPLVAALLLVAASLAYGLVRIAAEERRPLERGALVTLAQGNQKARFAWDRGGAERQLLTYVGLSRQALEAKPDLVVWPEYAVALYPENEPTMIAALKGLAQSTRAGLVFGAPRVESGTTPARYFNSAYHLAPDGRLASYDKVHPVPFAEYWPLGIREATAADERTFGAGTRSLVFPSGAGRIGALICYESIFPELSRALVHAGAEILVNVSNDGWLDRAGLGAGAQHLSITVFRAVENRRYVARAATSGISGFIDPLGRPFALLAENTRGITSATIAPRRDLTPYARLGDCFAGACALLALVLVTGARRA